MNQLEALRNWRKEDLKVELRNCQVDLKWLISLTQAERHDKRNYLEQQKFDQACKMVEELKERIPLVEQVLEELTANVA